MTNVYLFSVVLLCVTMAFVMGGPLPTNCEMPPDLSNINEKLNAATIQNGFLLLNRSISPSTHQEPTQGNMTCPEKLSSSGGVRDRSNCPWDYQTIEDPLLIPRFRFEAVCRCRECIATDGMHHCETVYTKETFFKQTSSCVGGFYVYEPVTKYIPTGCVCAYKRITRNQITNVYDL